MDSEVRNKILHAATELFFEFGPSRVKMEEIAEKLSMSKKTLYKYFASKDDLLHSIIEHFQCETREMLDPVMSAVQSVDDEEFLMQMSAMGEKMAQRMNTAFRSPFFKDLQRNYPALWQEFADLRRTHILHGFGHFCRVGMQRGLIRNDLNVDVMTRMYLASIENILTPSVLAEIPLTGGQLYHTIMSIMFEGAITDKCRIIGELHQEQRPSSKIKAHTLHTEPTRAHYEELAMMM